jgi:DNA mismatch endonuclease (patch repair protein)
MKEPLPRFAQPSKTRSANMRAIKSHNNRSTEWRLRSLLMRSQCRGWRLRAPGFLGKPDFVFPDANLLLFIDGCFWHGCPKCGHIPSTNTRYWTAKIIRNKERDKRYSRVLRSEGYRVLRIWECELKKNPGRCLQRLLNKLIR